MNKWQQALLQKGGCLLRLASSIYILAAQNPLRFIAWAVADCNQNPAKRESIERKKGKIMAYSGIGGQAVMEGVMMKNQEVYAVAVRKPDHEIVVERKQYTGVC